MKKASLIITFFLFAITWCYGQNKTTNVHLGNISKEKKAELYAQYPHFDELPFPNMPDKATKHKLLEDEWHRLWDGFFEFCHSKNLYNPKRNVLEVCLHFNELGHIDYFGHAFKKENEYSKKFIEYFEEYMKTFTFNAKAGVKFSKCGQLIIHKKD